MNYEEKQHSILKSVFLHLFPGLLIVIFYVFVGRPIAERISYPPYFGFLLADCFVLIPFQFGYLIYLGKKRNGKFSLKGIISYIEPVSHKKAALFIVSLFISVGLLSLALKPLDEFILSELFYWIPDWFHFQYDYDTYSKTAILHTGILSLILVGLIVPIIEEVYFRGYLLPRISRYKLKSTILNNVLFEAYHFWSPWKIVSRIIYFQPVVTTVYVKRNIYLGIWVHCLGNIIGELLTLSIILNYV